MRNHEFSFGCRCANIFNDTMERRAKEHAQRDRFCRSAVRNAESVSTKAKKGGATKHVADQNRSSETIQSYRKQQYELAISANPNVFADNEKSYWIIH